MTYLQIYITSFILAHATSTEKNYAADETLQMVQYGTENNEESQGKKCFEANILISESCNCDFPQHCK